MSSFTHQHIHEVAAIVIGEVTTSKGMAAPGSRWQSIRFLCTDGSEHEVTAYLFGDYPGFTYMQRDATPARRAEDMPRALGNPFEEPFSDGSEGGHHD